MTMMTTHVIDPTEDQIHRILLENHFFFTIAQTCEKWGITPYRLRKWKRASLARVIERRHSVWTLEDCVIAAIWTSGPVQPAELIGWLDYRNHALYSASEVEQLFLNLERVGEVRRTDDGWVYVQVDPPFIFGPRLPWPPFPRAT